MGCVSDGDCASDPNGAICDLSSGDCVECIPSGDPFVDDCGLEQLVRQISEKASQQKASGLRPSNSAAAGRKRTPSGHSRHGRFVILR